MSKEEQLDVIEVSLDFLEREMDAQENRLEDALCQCAMEHTKMEELAGRVRSLRRDFERIKRLPPSNPQSTTLNPQFP